MPETRVWVAAIWRPPVPLARLFACRRHPAGPRFQGAAHGGHILGAVAEARGVPTQRSTDVNQR